MIFKLLLSLEKISYGTLGVKEFEVGIWKAKAGNLRRLRGDFNFLNSGCQKMALVSQCFFTITYAILISELIFEKRCKNHLQDFVFGYKKTYALFFH